MRKKKNRVISLLLSILMLVTTIAPLGGLAGAEGATTAQDLLACATVIPTQNITSSEKTSDGILIGKLLAAQNVDAITKTTGIKLDFGAAGIDVDLTNNPCLYLDYEAFGNAKFGLTIFYENAADKAEKYYQIIQQYTKAQGSQVDLTGGASSGKLDIGAYFNQSDSYKARLYNGKLRVKFIQFNISGDKDAQVRLKRLTFDGANAVYPDLTPKAIESVGFAMQDPHYYANLLKGKSYPTKLTVKDVNHQEISKEILKTNYDVQYIVTSGNITIDENGIVAANDLGDFGIKAQVKLKSAAEYGSVELKDYDTVGGKVVAEAAAAPTANPAAGTYTGTQSVKLATATTGAEIYYTTDGSIPRNYGEDTNGTKYSDTTPIVVDKNTTIKAIATKEGIAVSDVVTIDYTINPAKPNGSVLIAMQDPHYDAKLLKGKTYPTKLLVKDTDGKEISQENLSKYYDVTYVVTSGNVTIDTNGIVTANDLGAFQVDVKVKLKSATEYGKNVGVDFDYIGGNVVAEAAAAPTANPAAGTYTGTQSVKLATATTDAAIYYTTDGSIPRNDGGDTNGAQYTTPIVVDKNTTIKAIATKEGIAVSDVVTIDYTINPAANGNLITMDPGFEDGTYGMFAVDADDTAATKQRSVSLVTKEKDGNANNKAMLVKIDPAKSRSNQPQNQIMCALDKRLTLQPGKLYEFSYDVKVENYTIPDWTGFPDEKKGFILIGGGVNFYRNTTGSAAADMFLDLARAEDIHKHTNFPDVYKDWKTVKHYIAAPITETAYASPRVIVDVRNYADMEKVTGLGADVYFDNFVLKEVTFDSVDLTLNKIGDIFVGDSATLTVVPKANTGTEIRLAAASIPTAVKLESSDPTVATVSEAHPSDAERKGNNVPTIAEITPVKAGSTTITATVTINGVAKTKSVNITVKPATVYNVTMDAYKTSTAPTIDGSLNSGEWNLANQMALQEETYSGTDSGKFDIKWDDTYLYLGALVENSKGTLVKGDDWCKGNCISIYFDPTMHKSSPSSYTANKDLQIGIGYNDAAGSNTPFVMYGGGANQDNTQIAQDAIKTGGGVFKQKQISANSWSVEAKIPLTALSIDPTKNAFGFNIDIENNIKTGTGADIDDTESVFTHWAADGTHTFYNQTTGFGKVRLTAAPVKVAAPTAAPFNGYNFVNPMNVTLKAETGAKIYYTTDGSTPTVSSNIYANPISVIDTMTIKTIAVKDGCLDSDVVSFTYTKVAATKDPLVYDFRVVAPAASGGTGTTPIVNVKDYKYVLDKNASLTKLSPSAPWCFGAKMDDATNFVAGAADLGVGINIAGKWASFRINVPQSGNYKTSIHFWDSPDPRYIGELNYYFNPVSTNNPIDETGKIGTYDMKPATGSMKTLDLVESKYIEAGEYYFTVKLGANGYAWMAQLILAPVVTATPTITPNGGVVNGTQQVTLACATTDAKIYYTADGTEPTATSTEYKAAFSIDKACTIKAIAISPTLGNSKVASATFTAPTGLNPYHPVPALAYVENMVSLKASNAPTVDGNLTEWTLAKPLAEIGKTAPTTSKFDMTWDDTYVYIAADIKRTGALVAPTFTDGKMTAKGTHVSFFFDPTAHQGLFTDKIGTSGKTGLQLGDIQISVSYNPTDATKAYVTFGGGGPFANESVISANSKAALKANAAGDGFAVEVAFRWQDLLITPKVDEYFAFELFDEDNLKWASNGKAEEFWNKSDNFGKVTLAAAPELKSVWFAVKDNLNANLVAGTTYDTELKLFADLGQEDQITDTTGKTVVYKVTTAAAEDPNGASSTIATVDATTGKITAVSAGTCKIWATATLNGKSATDSIGATITAAPATAVTLSSAVADGTSNTTTSTKITFTFDKAITGLTADSFTITTGTGSATKGTLTGSGTTYTLAITPTKEGNVSVAVANPTGFTISGSPKTVAVYYKAPTPAKPLVQVWFAVKDNLNANLVVGTTNDTELKLYSAEGYKDEDLITNTTGMTVVYKVTTAAAEDPNGASSTIATVDATTGKITAVSAGTCKIWATVTLNGKSATDVIGSTITAPEKVATPTANPAAGTYTSARNVILSCATTGAEIYYTTNGSAPTTSSTKYTAAIPVSATTTIKAIAVKSGMPNSDVATFVYTITVAPQKVATPTANPAAGTYTSAQNVTLSCGTTGAEIYYTTNGSAPTTSSTKYTAAIPVSATTTIKAIAVKSGMPNSDVATLVYTINNNPNKVVAPTANPVSGTSFKDTMVVNLVSATVDSTIYYTTDGTVPTTASTKYTAPIILSKTTTIKAIAVKSSMDNSDVATFTYTKGIANQVATPTTDLVPGLGFSSAISIRLNCDTVGAKIYYTLDGSIPTTSSHEYEGRAIILTNTTTIKAIAVKDGMTDSVVMIAPYMLINSPSYDNRPINKPNKPDDTVKPPVSTEPTTATTTTKVDVNEKGVASVTASQQDLADSIKNAKEVAKKNGTTANGIELQLNVKTDKEADKIDVQISKDTLNTIASKDVKTFNVVSDNVNVAFDAAAIAEVKKQASGDVSLSISKVESKDLSPEAAKMVGSRPVVDLKIGDISSFGQGKVHVAIPYKLAANENQDDVRAAYITKDGKVEILSDSAYNKETGCVEFYTGHFSIYGVVKVAKVAEFKDTANHWAKDDIAFVATQGILGGTGKDVFSPDMSITRGMFVTALGRLAGADITGFTTSSFSDVQFGKYYLPYIEWAVKNGIVRGIGNGKFAPDKAITREEMAAIMANYAKAMGINLQAKNAEIKFADNASISAWARDAVKAMQTAGIIGGKGNNKFDPKGTATRAEVSAVLKRFMELIGA